MNIFKLRLRKEKVYFILRLALSKANTLNVKAFSLVKKKLSLSVLDYFNTIPAWVLENQLGGGQFDPPSKSHVLCPNMTNDTSLESSCALLLESAKNLQICKN